MGKVAEYLQRMYSAYLTCLKDGEKDILNVYYKRGHGIWGVLTNRTEIAHKKNKIAAAIFKILKEEGRVFELPEDKGSYVDIGSRINNEYYNKKSRALPYANCALYFGNLILFKYEPIATHEGDKAWAPSCFSLLDALLRIIDVKGKKVCDLGCGDGRFCIAASLAGAREAHGYDLHNGLIEGGKNIIKELEIENIFLERKNIFELELSDFDIVYMSLQRMLPNKKRKLVEKISGDIVCVSDDLGFSSEKILRAPLNHGETSKYPIYLVKPGTPKKSDLSDLMTKLDRMLAKSKV